MKESTNATTSYVCACARITEEDFRKILEETDAPNYAALKAAHGIGGQCTSCEYEVKGLLDEHLGEIFAARKEAAAAAKKAAGVKVVEPARRKGFAGFLRRIRGGAVKVEAETRPVAPVVAKEMPVKANVKETYRTGVFFLRKDGLESHLAIANLQFPEHGVNPNGDAVTFHVSLYGEDGAHLATSPEMRLENNRSGDYSPEELFPDVKGDVVGAMYTDFDEVSQTGSLRPYGVLINTAGPARAWCHYHDKFALFTDPGFFQNTSPFEPGQTCWMSISNCQGKAYESEYFLQAGGKTWKGRMELGAMESRWVRLGELFPDLDEAAEELSPGLFWLENPQHVMVYFFWHMEGSNVWMGQHH